MIAKLEENIDANDAGFQLSPLWTGPSTLVTIRTSKCQPFDSLLKPTFKDATGFKKQHRDGSIHLGHWGFENDEHAYVPHQTPERAVLQYNPDHYTEWKRHLRAIKVKDDTRRDALMQIGGFGENIVVENSPDTPPMDESSMCIGDLVGFRSKDGSEGARMRINGFRMPCYKLNHRFGLPNMSKLSQDKGWVGWLYAVDKEGNVEVGDQMVLLDRPFPNWTVSRVMYYTYKEPRNFDAIREALDELNGYLCTDVRELFEDRLMKGMEDMSLRLQGDKSAGPTTDFRLCDKIRETDRVSEFVFKRVDKLSKDSEALQMLHSGSHVRLHLNVEGRTVIRPYSVISGDPNEFRLGVALADESRGGSAFMHKNLKVGDIVKISPSFQNTFALGTENVKEHIFLAGGIGITAFLDHIRYCLATNQNFHLHYMIRNKSDYAFKKLIENLMTNATNTQKLTIYVSADGRRCNLKQLLSDVAKAEQTHIYACGSEKMADDVRENVQMLKIPQSRTHYEQFTVDTSGDPFTVETSESKKKIDVGARQSLLDALRDAGLAVASSCESGNCGTCKVRVKCGRILHKGEGLMDEEKAGYDGKVEGDMLSCVSRGVGTITIEI